MTKITVISGFLGAGKTTFIKKLLKEALQDTKVVLIENEFGEIGIDGGFLKDAGIEIKEMNAGCICCSLVGDFGTSLEEVLKTYEPEHILIEPSGVGKLSDVIKAVEGIKAKEQVVLGSAVAVVDALKCRMYLKNFGEFFKDQIEYAGTIVLSRTAQLGEEKLAKCVELIRTYNKNAVIVTTPWDELNASDILDAMEGRDRLEEELLESVEGCGCGHHHDHDHGGCGCGHHHDHESHDEKGCGCGHDHDHHDEEGCSCGHHHEHDHHHADEVFTSWGTETPRTYTKEEIESILVCLGEEKEFGMVLRAKGIVQETGGGWIYFDYVPGESDIRSGKAGVTGKFCVIGAGLNEEQLEKLFLK